MPFANILLHFVWSTKDRISYLQNSRQRYELFSHILSNARKKGIFIDTIGGEKEHVHCLLSLGVSQSPSEVMRLLKGEATHWYHVQNWGILQWQDDYFVASVSPNVADSVRQYIIGQEEHHRERDFAAEFADFLRRGGFKHIVE